MRDFPPEECVSNGSCREPLNIAYHGLARLPVTHLPFALFDISSYFFHLRLKTTVVALSIVLFEAASTKHGQVRSAALSTRAMLSFSQAEKLEALTGPSCSTICSMNRAATK